jgi:hypothetical protein
LRIMAVRISRRRLTNSAQNPKSQRSAVRRSGARRRERCRTRSCCFKRIFSARTARVPPVPRRTASLASRCTGNTIAFFTGKQLARYWIWWQGSRIAAEGPLNYEFVMHTSRYPDYLSAGGSRVKAGLPWPIGSGKDNWSSALPKLDGPRESYKTAPGGVLLCSTFTPIQFHIGKHGRFCATGENRQ